jgi:MerR family mercuric resistance operon transcriptional regulator
MNLFPYYPKSPGRILRLGSHITQDAFQFFLDLYLSTGPILPLEVQMELFTIGQLARRANVNSETIRFYERTGLLPKPPRNRSGHRQYSITELKRTVFIKRTQSLGFSLQEISGLLSLRIQPGKTCGDVKEKVKAKLIDIEEKIKTLQRMREVLLRLETHCPGKGPLSECPILETLDQ